MTAMRKKARETGVYLRVVKNTLASRAGGGHRIRNASGRARRSAAVCVLDRGTRRRRRLIKEVRQGNDKLVAKVVSVEGRLLPAARVDVLASLPTREQALAMLAACWPNRRRCSPASSRPWPTSGGSEAARACRNRRRDRLNPYRNPFWNQISRGNRNVLSNEQIVDAIAAKSLMEVMDLVKAIEDKFGVTAAARS